MVFEEENDARNYLDQVDRGGNTGLRQGQIYWCIDNAEHHFTDCESKFQITGINLHFLVTSESVVNYLTAP